MPASELPTTQSAQPAPTQTANITAPPAPEQSQSTEAKISQILQSENKNPKLDTHLNLLILAEEAGIAEAYAIPRGIKLIDGSVRVIIECVPGQVDAAAKAAVDVGATQVDTLSSYNLVAAVVPITSLDALSEEESIGFIRQPVRPVPGAGN